MKTTKHPLLDLIINEDGSYIVFEGKVLDIKIYKPNNKHNYTVRQVNFRTRTHNVSKLVCEAWNGMRENREQFIHRYDLNPDNDHYTNLYWDTKKGTRTPRTKRSCSSKIKIDEIPGVVERIKAGETLENIAKSYNTSDSSILRIKKRFITDKKLILKESFMKAKDGYDKRLAIAKYLGFKTVTNALNAFGKREFILKCNTTML